MQMPRRTRVYFLRDAKHDAWISIFSTKGFVGKRHNKLTDKQHELPDLPSLLH